MRKAKTKKRTPSEEKKEFRTTDTWINFRREQRALQDKDPVTLRKLAPRANLHHYDQRHENYKKLSPERFVFLNSKTHSFIHWAYVYWKRDKENFIKRLIYIFEMMDKFSND